MLRLLITTVAARPASTSSNRLQPAELQAIIESLPEVARVIHARRRPATTERQPRSVCTTLKDLCEF